MHPVFNSSWLCLCFIMFGTIQAEAQETSAEVKSAAEGCTRIHISVKLSLTSLISVKLIIIDSYLITLQMYHHVILCSLCICYLCLVFRFFIAELSTSIGAFLLRVAPLQFPLTVEHVELTTLRAWVFLRNSLTQGFSFTRPLCLCLPKKFSRGSWHRRLLRNTLTPSMVNTNLTRKEL